MPYPDNKHEHKAVKDLLFREERGLERLCHKYGFEYWNYFKIHNNGVGGITFLGGTKSIGRNIIGYSNDLANPNKKEEERGVCFGASVYLLLLNGDMQKFEYLVVNKSHCTNISINDYQNKSIKIELKHSFFGLSHKFLQFMGYTIDDAGSAEFFKSIVQDTHEAIAYKRACSGNSLADFMDRYPACCFFISQVMVIPLAYGDSRKYRYWGHIMAGFNNGEGIALYDPSFGFFFKKKEAGYQEKISEFIVEKELSTQVDVCKKSYYSIYAYKPLNENIASFKVMSGVDDIII